MAKSRYISGIIMPPTIFGGSGSRTSTMSRVGCTSPWGIAKSCTPMLLIHLPIGVLKNFADFFRRFTKQPLDFMPARYQPLHRREHLPPRQKFLHRPRLPELEVRHQGSGFLTVEPFR